VPQRRSSIRASLIRWKGTRCERVYGKRFWAEGYRVSMVGLDEQVIWQYIRQQEKLAAGQNALDLEQA
jgi:hypothetical protein